MLIFLLFFVIVVITKFCWFFIDFPGFIFQKWIVMMSFLCILLPPPLYIVSPSPLPICVYVDVRIAIRLSISIYEYLKSSLRNLPDVNAYLKMSYIMLHNQRSYSRTNIDIFMR